MAYDVDIMLYNGDIVCTSLGDIKLIDGDTEIIQSAMCSILTKYGELELNPDYGNKIYSRRIKMNESGLRLVESDCKNAILLGDTRIEDVPSITATFGDIPGKCNVMFTLKTIDGNMISSDLIVNLTGQEV